MDKQRNQSSEEEVKKVGAQSLYRKFLEENIYDEIDRLAKNSEWYFIGQELVNIWKNYIA